MRLARTVSSQRLSGNCQTGSSAEGHMPATAAQTSIAPNSSRARENNCSTCASSVRSAPTTGAPPSSAATASARSRPRW